MSVEGGEDIYVDRRGGGDQGWGKTISSCSIGFASQPEIKTRDLLDIQCLFLGWRCSGELLLPESETQIGKTFFTQQEQIG